MKKIFALALAVIMMAVCLTACSPKGPTLADVKKAGKLTVATSPDFPPFENLEGGQVVGIEVEILEKICNELGIEFVLEQINFDAVLVTAAQTDVLIFDLALVIIKDVLRKNCILTIEIELDLLTAQLEERHLIAANRHTHFLLLVSDTDRDIRITAGSFRRNNDRCHTSFTRVDIFRTDRYAIF